PMNPSGRLTRKAVVGSPSQPWGTAKTALYEPGAASFCSNETCALDGAAVKGMTDRAANAASVNLCMKCLFRLRDGIGRVPGRRSRLRRWAAYGRRRFAPCSRQAACRAHKSRLALGGERLKERRRGRGSRRDVEPARMARRTQRAIRPLPRRFDRCPFVNVAAQNEERAYVRVLYYSGWLQSGKQKRKNANGREQAAVAPEPGEPARRSAFTPHGSFLAERAAHHQHCRVQHAGATNGCE